MRDFRLRNWAFWPLASLLAVSCGSEDPEPAGNDTGLAVGGTAASMASGTATSGEPTEVDSNSAMSASTTSASTSASSAGGVSSTMSSTSAASSGAGGASSAVTTTGGDAGGASSTMSAATGAGGTGLGDSTEGDSTMTDAAGGTTMVGGDTWSNFAAQFFIDYCAVCHNDDNTGDASRDYNMLSAVMAEPESIACGVATAATRPSLGCPQGAPQAEQFPNPAGGAEPTAEERERLVAWIEAGMPE